jgi:hypothetical protein
MLVDDALNPTLALLWSPRHWSRFLATRDDGVPPARMLRDVVQLLLTLDTDSGGSCLTLPSDAWLAVLLDLFGHAFRPRPRLAFNFVDSLPALQLPRECPEGCRIVPMDRRYQEGSFALDYDLKSYWPDLDQLRDRGAGYCAVDAADRVLSVAWSVYAPTDSLELAVATAADQRGCGLCTITAGHLIRRCLDRGLRPVWATDLDNHASQAVACKLGFARASEHNQAAYTPFNAGRRSIKILPSQVEELSGAYRTPNGIALRIGPDARGSFRLFDTIGNTFTLAAESESDFFLLEMPTSLSFTRSPGGDVTGFIRKQGGRESHTVRVTEIERQVALPASGLTKIPIV